MYIFRIGSKLLILNSFCEISILFVVSSINVFYCHKRIRMKLLFIRKDKNSRNMTLGFLLKITHCDKRGSFQGGDSAINYTLLCIHNRLKSK